MSSFINHAGLTITSTKLQLVEVVYNGDQFILNNVDEVFFNEPLDLEKDKETKILTIIQSAYDELLIRKPLISNHISFTLPLSIFHVMQIPYDNTLLNQDLIEEFRWELSVLYPYLNVNDLVIQYLEIEKNPLNDNNSAIVIALNRKLLNHLYKFCEQNKLKLKFVDNAHIASDRALFLNNSLNDKGITLSVFFSYHNLSVIFSFNGKPVYFRIFTLKDAGEIIPLLNDVINNNKIISINKKLITSAFITGDEISSAVTDSLSKNIGIPFSYFNPFAKITPDKELYTNKYFSEKYNSFTPAAGIAFRLS